MGKEITGLSLADIVPNLRVRYELAVSEAMSRMIKRGYR